MGKADHVYFEPETHAGFFQPLPELGGDAMKSVVRGFLQIDERMISLISLETILDEAVTESKVAA